MNNNEKKEPINAKNNEGNFITPENYPSMLRLLADEYEKRQLSEKESKERN